MAELGVLCWGDIAPPGDADVGLDVLDEDGRLARAAWDFLHRARSPSGAAMACCLLGLRDPQYWFGFIGSSFDVNDFLMVLGA